MLVSHCDFCNRFYFILLHSENTHQLIAVELWITSSAGNKVMNSIMMTLAGLE